MKRALLSILCVVALIAAMTTPISAQAGDNPVLYTHIAGDVDRSWAVDSSDVRAIYCVASGERENTLSSAADVNGDGKLNIRDAFDAMRTALGTIDTTLVKPTGNEGGAVPEGEAIAFQVNDRHLYNSDSRRLPDLWVVQSYEELLAVYNHSYSRQDFTENYDEAYFEDKAIVIWATHHVARGLVDIAVTRVVKNDNELCLVRELRFFMHDAFDCFARFLIEIDKTALDGVDTITLCTEHYYYE